MKRALVLFLAAASAQAAETTTLPQGTFVVDVGYLHSTIDKRWDGKRHGLNLIEDIPRYEPGGGLQGTLSAKPNALYQGVLFQVNYGITDWLTLALYMPLIVATTVETNFAWVPGDFQSQLGRQYDEGDFWEWAGSLGQPRPPAKWVGNRSTLADFVVGLRAAIPQFSLTRKLGLRLAGTLQVALPTGRPADPEEVVAAGTTAFDLHSFGDVEVHAAWDRPFFVDGYGVPRLNLGGDFFFSWFRPRTMVTPTGVKNPLLLTYAPYVGATYVQDAGDWAGATLSLEVSPLLGPTFGTFVSGNDVEKARAFPPMLTFLLGYTYIATGQSRWYSDSALWNYDREKLWQPGDKNIFRFGVTVSLLRVGLPIQLYAQYRGQEIIPGRFTRPSNVLTAGVRAVLKFW
ncbi:MAG: hypothetical protein H6Q89_817 [Myxococcaceae bacterium]|nr:hypothetical protein [Myxococcaceae bacterium]